MANINDVMGKNGISPSGMRRVENGAEKMLRLQITSQVINSRGQSIAKF
jgi:hypothetical protein